VKVGIRKDMIELLRLTRIKRCVTRVTY